LGFGPQSFKLATLHRSNSWCAGIFLSPQWRLASPYSLSPKGNSMHPVHDFDALLLLAVALSSKRRPADLVEIMAAADLIQGNIPTESKLSDAFSRLAVHGLLIEQDGGYALTPDAQKLVESVPRKVESAERIFHTRDFLSEYITRGEHANVLVTAEQIKLAIQAHRTAGLSKAKNLLIPKPKPAEAPSRPGQRQRRPAPQRRRKD
jgi:hypothetical protein